MDSLTEKREAERAAVRAILDRKPMTAEEWAALGAVPAAVRTVRAITTKPTTDRRQLKEPSLAVKAKNFAVASAKHAAAGFPQATDEQVAERFAACESCPLFKPKGDDHGVCTHGSCGCSLKAVGLSGKNKLRWADQSCPVGRWKSIPPSPGAK